MTFYEVSGDIEVSIYGACDKKINSELASAIKKAIKEVWDKYGSVEASDIEINTDELEYEKEED